MAKKEYLDEIVQKLDRAFGKGTLMRLGGEGRQDIDVIPTGIDVLDRVLGIGGLPRGRIIEVFGHESSGKTTIAVCAIAQAQKKGGIAAFVDAEHALDPNYARILGVDTESLLLSQPDFGEQALEVVDALVRTGEISIVVVDSVAALVPKAELEGAMGDSHLGLQARLMSQALRKITPMAAKTGTTVVFINQIRQKIGVVYGSNEITTGGTALKFYSSVRIEVKKAGQVKNSDEVYGHHVRTKIVKNKMAPPFGVAEFDILFGKGIDTTGILLDEALKQGVITRSGSWYSFMNEKIGQGKVQVIEAINSNEALKDQIKQAIAAL